MQSSGFNYQHNMAFQLLVGIALVVPELAQQACVEWPLHNNK